ncbi:MAG: hypothetical protein NTV98_00155 [Candidatus Roizmanbacteria bacterium]|nr:hypothetical protein [Candidatus Roizmanbacteria bacterium]
MNSKNKVCFNSRLLICVAIVSVFFVVVALLYYGKLNFNTNVKNKALLQSSTAQSLVQTQVLDPTPTLNPFPEPKLKDELPPVGKYCNGCYDVAPGANRQLYGISGSWVTGGYDENGGNKWSYIDYIISGQFPLLPKQTGMVIPGENFLSDVKNISLNQTKEYLKDDKKYSYKKLAEIINKDGIIIYTYEVTPTFDSDSIARKDAILVKDNHTIYIMFDWKQHSFDATFDQIINSIRFEK